MDITTQIDDMIHNLPYGQITQSIWIMWVAVVVVLIALGLEFWRNIWSMWFFPRMSYPRIAGELQIVPGLFVALMFGLINGIISFNYYRIQEVAGSFLCQADTMIKPLLEQLSSMAGVEFTSIVNNMITDPDYVFGLLATVPILCGIGWFMFALALFIVSKTMSKTGGSLSSYLSGTAYFAWMTPLFFLGYWIGFLNPGLAMVFRIAGAVLMIYYLVLTMRDFLHISWGNTFVGVIIVAPILYSIFMALFIIGVIYAVNQLGAYI